jgi:lipopolysaccharide transport protein LptA
MPKLFESLCACAAAHCCIAASPVCAQTPSAGDSIAWETDSFSLDRKSNVMTFEGFRVTADTWNLRADRASALADQLDFSDGEWRFSGNIHVELDTSVLEAGEATFRFADQKLLSAELRGTPVSFEDTAPEREGPVRGTAEIIRYDEPGETLELLGQVSLSVGPYLTTGCDLVYFLVTEDFTTGSEQCSEPFRMILVPKRDPGATADSTSADGEPPQ